MSDLTRRLGHPAYDDLGPDENLTPLLTGQCADPAAWRPHADELRQAWSSLLGRPSFDSFDPTVDLVDRFVAPEFRGTLYRQPTGPGQKQLVLIAEPLEPATSPRPGAVAPFYHPDFVAGYDLKAHRLLDQRRGPRFALELVRQGYIVACPEAFPFNTVPEPTDSRGFGWWQAAADRLLTDHPGWTGMGKLIHDTRRAVDLLFERPDLDRSRIVTIGHSLGGKMAFYAGCLDERVKAIVASDFGIGWSFTNWTDPWYFGDRILAPGFSLANHQMLALHAPNPFFLIAGEADRPASWQYLQAARPVYQLLGHPDGLGCFDHATGHAPTDESLDLAYRWLADQFQLAVRPWR